MHSEADQPLKKSPDQTVADSIVAKLLDEALITNEDAKGLSQKIAVGKVSPADWAVMIKMGLSKS